MNKKFLCAVLAVCVAFCAIQTLVSADEDSVPATAWRDYAAENFAGGTGTESDPYKITNGAELAKIAVDVNNNDYTKRTTYSGVYFRLESDIDLSAHRWNPIGVFTWYLGSATTSNSFNGFLDGNDKKITGLIVDETTDKSSAGLFGNIRNSSKNFVAGARDLTIENARVYFDVSGLEESNAGILAGFILISEGSKCEFDNISVSGRTEHAHANGSAMAGGMFGSVSRITVRNCKATDVEISNVTNSGGFVGLDCGSTYEYCSATGKIDGAWALGGFVGESGSCIYQDPKGASTFSHCTAAVNITAHDWRAGGFIGYAEYTEIQNCAAYGNIYNDVTGNENWNDPNLRVGGFAGEASAAAIENCHTVSRITMESGNPPACGFMYSSSGEVGNCSYDIENNSGLSATQEGTEDDSIKGLKRKEVLSNICEDVLDGHIWSETFTVDKEPTCTEEGYESQHCIRCDKAGEVSMLEKVPHEWNSEYTVDKKPTCTGKGEESIHCKNCDAKKESREIEATGHTFKWVTDREPTETETGLKHEECTVCGFKKEGVEIPKKNKPVGTSDVALTATAVTLVLASLAAAAVVVKKKQSL